MSIPIPTELIAFVRERYASMQIAEITVAYNLQFGAQLTERQVLNVTRNHKIKSGRDTRFGAQGFKPWNTGTKGQGLTGPNAGTFKKGNLPHNHKPLWSERVDTKDGYIQISVPETNPHTGFSSRYKHKHVWIWEQANGPVPKGKCVIILDGIKPHCELDNLALVSRKELLTLNQHNYAAAPPELKPSILALARLEANAGIRSCPAVGRAKRKEA
jgi:hypothetical protein